VISFWLEKTPVAAGQRRLVSKSTAVGFYLNPVGEKSYIFGEL
jgi:hypothetical protein